MPVPVIALLAGTAQPFARGEQSAIAKAPIVGPVDIGLLGIAGDEQADQRVHGGPDKALHHYPADHYAHWGRLAVDHPLLNAPGAFGENISTWGLTEADVCIGDRIRLGSALLEVSQPRQPCWKQGQRMEWTTLPAMMVREGRSGWYYRVVEPGTAQAGDIVALAGRTHPNWSIARVFALLVAGQYKGEREALAQLAALDPLFAGLRERAATLLDSA
jgi:MOSC domain-containing protein YiiM